MEDIAFHCNVKKPCCSSVLLTTVALIPGNKTFSLPSNFGYGILYIPAQRTILRQKGGNKNIEFPIVKTDELICASR